MKGFVAALFLLATSASAFAPVAVNQRAATSLEASKSSNDGFRVAAVSTVAAAFLAANVAAPAFAAQQDMMDFGSSDVIAARSGGRAGGRASSGGASRSSSYRPSSSTTYRSSTTIVAPRPSVIVAPPVVGYGGYGYGYQPPSLGGLATGYALGSMGNIGNDMRDYRQEREIQDSRYQLEQARLKEAELEGRLRALEAQPR
eukprot:CAMPEP_0172440682 /NCGR_PEP_ID=MMETSP1065-20121228/1315_1 /TAXON_ID=265537 /ORGANISM="Amphiprora paludosa, Strain CCMP125" /LENGTH=200 /DNA_ID=CAMNT_0013189653 /DNA_START=70 /DNA_END=672 /DNA_ORIENTATION=+